MLPGTKEMSRLVALPLALVASLALGSTCHTGPDPTPADLCLTPLADDEPLCNPSAVDSPWGTSHRVSYAQASSPLPGPTPEASVTASHVVLPGTPIALAFSSQYDDGQVAIWGSPLGLEGAIAKLDYATFSVVDLYVPAEREVDPPDYTAGISGAYNAVDADDHFIVGRTRFLEVYADTVAGDRFSPIALVKREFLPDSAFCRGDDVVAGMVLTYDDHVAFVTEEAVVGVIPRDPAEMTAANLQAISLNGADCDDASIARDDLEIVSNSLAADENGGLYVVTSTTMYKFEIADGALGLVWEAAYEAGDGTSGVRLGAGSGSTPSLMGTDASDDRFVVITDGQDLMHLVLLWRDEIPADWTPLPGRDPRIACEIPVTFGDPQATVSLSEQSVLVRGQAAVVVNNLLSDESPFETLPPILRNLLSALEGGNPDQAPYGVERIDWDPLTRTCSSVWANAEISIPNGIPTMSAATGLFYGIGQRDGVWGVEGVDFETGESKLFAPAAQTACSQEAIDSINPLILPIVTPVLERLPGSCENSFYAGTEVGPDGGIVTGTFQGASRYLPSFELPPDYGAQGHAGVRQGIDLADRVLRGLSSGDLAGALDAARRGVVQLDHTSEALWQAWRRGAGPDAKVQQRLANAARYRFEFVGEILAQPAPDPEDLAAAEYAMQVAALKLLYADTLSGS